MDYDVLRFWIRGIHPCPETPIFQKNVSTIFQKIYSHPLVTNSIIVGGKIGKTFKFVGSRSIASLVRYIRSFNYNLSISDVFGIKPNEQVNKQVINVTNRLYHLGCQFARFVLKNFNLKDWNVSFQRPYLFGSVLMIARPKHNPNLDLKLFQVNFYQFICHNLRLMLLT